MLLDGRIVREWSDSEIAAVSELLGEAEACEYGSTSSDIMQRYIPSLVLTAYPDKAITADLAIELAHGFVPTPPFRSQEN